MDALFLYGIKSEIKGNEGKSINDIVRETFTDKITINLSTLGNNLLEIKVGSLSYIIVKNVAQNAISDIKSKMALLKGGKVKKSKTRKGKTRRKGTRKLRKHNKKTVIVIQKGGVNFKNIIAYLCIFLIMQGIGFGVNFTGTLPEAQEGEFDLAKVWGENSIDTNEATNLVKGISEVTIEGSDSDVETFMSLTENPPTETGALSITNPDFLGEQARSLNSGNKTIISQQLWTENSPMAKMTDLLNTMKLRPRSRLITPVDTGQGLSVMVKYHIEETPTGDNNVVVDSILKPAEDSVQDTRFESMADILTQDKEKRDIVINSARQQVYTAIANGMLTDKTSGTVMLLLVEFPVHQNPAWQMGRSDHFHRDGSNIFKPPSFNHTEQEGLQSRIKGYPCSMCGGMNPYDLIMTMTYDPKTTPYMAKFRSIGEVEGEEKITDFEGQLPPSTLHTSFLNQQGDQLDSDGNKIVAQHSGVYQYSNVHRRSILGFITRGDWEPREGVRLETAWSNSPDIEQLD